MNDLDLHITCLQLCPLLFSMGHHNYARYLTVYFISLLNLSDSHPGAESLLRNNGFSVCRSDVPASRTAVDLMIEQTINRHAKTRGDIVGFSRSLPAYFRWSVTRHHRASYVSATHDMADIGDLSNDSHKELTPARKLHSENQVQETIKAFTAFINHFDVQPENLVCLSSGLKVLEDVASDLLKWCEDDFLPKELLDIITEDNCSENEDSIDDEGELPDASSDEIMSSEDEQSDDDF
ncbi:hypothetical protein RRG08_024294 [Elysia crispata]|uniref:Uncharacterized protein n=1 Tax=Elysia crispata TaxID=231223 RepID=A0AAE0ZKU6_9GAST|nr:hypothetical protein RRG08_024294 [Elysia crispata]